MKLTKKKLEQLIKESIEETEEERQLRLMSNLAKTLVRSKDPDSIRHLLQVGEQAEFVYSSDGGPIEREYYGDPSFEFKTFNEELYKMLVKSLQVESIKGDIQDKSSDTLGSYERDYDGGIQYYQFPNDNTVIIRFSTEFSF